MKEKIEKLLINKYCEILLLILIIINIICLGFETDKNIYLQHQHLFKYIETFSIIIFSVEYVSRVFILRNIKDLFKPLLFVDLISILPFYLPILGVDLRFLRIFRLFRIIRIFKIARYFDALQMICKVIYNKRVELTSIFGVLLFLIFLSSFLMFYAESSAQPDVFKNILDTFWWSIVTLTTVGYGDIYPITPLGKLLSAIIVLIGIMLFALPTSILTAEFLKETQNKDKNK